MNSITGKKVTYGPITPGAQRTPETPDSAVDSEVHFTEVVVKDKGRVRAVVDDYGFHMKALEYQAEQKKSGITVEYGDALIAVSKAEKQAALFKFFESGRSGPAGRRRLVDWKRLFNDLTIGAREFGAGKQEESPR